MNDDINALSAVPAVVVIACWWVFAQLFLFRKRHPKGKQQKRNRTSLLGVGVVGVGYALVWSFRRPIFTPLCECGPLVDWIVAVAAVLASISSVWILVAAVRRLGRQWSVAAEVVDDHQLVRDGLYSIVRHPIYTGMLGMLIATGLAFSLPVWILVASVLAWYGTHLRIQGEEVLLKETFGLQYEEYARQVPALIPGITWIR
jgi:protein-S-isoprenylcysteine O-methyltransferase Ste14